MAHELRDPGQVGIDFPSGRRLRTSADFPSPRIRRVGSGGPTVLALFAVGILLGAVAVGGGFWLAGRSTVVQPPQEGVVSFTLVAFIDGFVGEGGDIAGDPNPTLEVKQGDRVTITVRNGQSIEHDFFIDGYGKHITGLTASGRQGSVTCVASEVGTFAYYCTIPGHRASGMAGTFVVGEAGSAPGPGPAQVPDVLNIARDPTSVPAPLGRTTPSTVHIYLLAREVVAEIEPGTTFIYWTFNASVPGPFFRVLVNDTVVVHFSNHATSSQNHSVDFHAVTGPGGGAVSTQTPAGQTTDFTFKAITPGLYVYHCASPHIPSHIAMGMYGLILVEPDGGLPAVDREFYVVQGDIYTKWAAGSRGHQLHDDTRLLAEDPTYVVFNGKFAALTGADALQANVNETIRIYFGVGGPNLISSFHVIGEMFDRVYSLGDVLSPPAQMVQTILVPPGGAAIVDIALQVPGNYILVDHALVRAIDKGSVGILTVSGPEDWTIFEP